jgi:hypothetical protein
MEIKMDYEEINFRARVECRHEKRDYTSLDRPLAFVDGEFVYLDRPQRAITIARNAIIHS